MYAVLDIESTGGKYNEEGITEIAIYRFDGHQVLDRFISLVNPERPIQEFVSKLTGINNKMLRTAPKFHEVARRIVEITDGCVLVAHNAQFDYRILKTEFNRLAYPFERPTLCTVALAQKLIPEAESHSLGKLVRSLGIPVSERHRANGDAMATLELFKLLLTKDLKKEIVSEFTKSKHQSILTDRQITMVEGLPHETGVFYFMNKKGEVIYLESSNNIAQRVSNLFAQDGEKIRTIQKSTKEVKYELTGNKLVADIKSYLERLNNSPRWNAKIKNFRFRYALIYLEDKNDLEILSIEEKTEHAIIIGRFNHLNKAKKCKSKLEKILHQSEADAKTIVQEHSIGKNYSLLLLKGRSAEERCVILFSDYNVLGYAYTKLAHQRFNQEVLHKIMVTVPPMDYINSLAERYLSERKTQNRILINSTP